MATKRKPSKRLIKKYQEILGIRKYRIFDIQVDPAELDCIAEVVCRNLKTNEFNLLLTQRDKDTVIHELLHILLWDYTALVESVIDVAGFSAKKKEAIQNELGDKEHEVIEKLIKAVMRI